MPGEKKAWAKKARRRHSVATAKFTRHEDDKLPGRSSSSERPEEEVAEEFELIEEQPEQADEAPLDSPDEGPVVEEATEEPEDLAEDPVEDAVEEAEEDFAEGAAEDPGEDLGEYVDELSRELDAIDETEEPEDEDEAELAEDEPAEDEDEVELAEDEVELAENEPVENTPSDEADEPQEPEPSEQPEDELPAEPLPVDEILPANQQEEIVEELEIRRERIPHEQPDLQAHSWGAAFKSDASERQKRPSRPKPTKREKPAPAPESDKLPGRSSSSEHPERPKPTKRVKPKPAPAPAPAPELTPAAAARQKPTKRKKPAPHYRYIKSPSLEQAFRNLLRLDAGAAWRATRIPLVTFFLCFVLLALAVADQAPAIDSFNTTINALVHGTRGMLDGFFVTITTLGDLLPMAALSLVVCVILAIARKWDSLAFFSTNVILAVVCVQALKFIFAVPRPGAETLVPIPGSFSFPSAHSFCSLIVFGMIGLLIYRALIRKRLPYNVSVAPGIILVVFAILIGISRIYVGVHWPSDVLGGWLLAGMWLPFASALYTLGARKVVPPKAAEEQPEQ